LISAKTWSFQPITSSVPETKYNYNKVRDKKHKQQLQITINMCKPNKPTKTEA